MRFTFQFYLLFLLLTIVFSCLREAVPGSVILVQDGEPINVMKVENSWKTENGALTGHGLYHYLNSYYYLHDDDFHLRARISWERVDTTTAIFMLFNNHFGFDSQANEKVGNGHFFFYSPVKKQYEPFGKALEFIQPGLPFDFEIIRRDSLFRFLVDGREVANIPLSWLTPPYEGIVGFRPWLNTIRVYDWTLEGTLTKLQKPEFVFANGESGYVCFREPAIVQSQNGDLLAFAVGRRENCWSDAGDMDIVLKISSDDGKSWSPLQVVWDAGPETCMQPAPVVDKMNGKIILLVSYGLGSDHFKDYLTGKNKEERRSFVLESLDNGKNWSTPREITRQVKSTGWWWYIPGPGSGIQLKHEPYRGRLVVGTSCIEKGTNDSYVGAVFSDDGGRNWQTGDWLDLEGGSECEIVELSTGVLLINARNRNKKAAHVWENPNYRIVARSYDGGQSWEEGGFDTTLIEPACMASLLQIEHPDFPEGLVLFSNPPDSTYRENLSVRTSIDNGYTWPWIYRIFDGPSAYSDLVDLGDGHGGCLYECGAASPYEGISFTRFSYEEIMKTSLPKKIDEHSFKDDG